MLQHTRVRTTDDVDAILVVPQIQMPGLFDALQARGFTIDVQKNLRELRDGFTTIRFGDVLVDLMQPVIPVFTHVLDRAINAEVLGQTVRISSAEGLILMKLIAMRPQDEVDIQALISTYGQTLDSDFIRSELEAFTDLNDPRRMKFEAWLNQSL